MMGYDNEDVDIEENKFDEKTANYCFVLSWDSNYSINFSGKKIDTIKIGEWFFNNLIISWNNLYYHKHICVSRTIDQNTNREITKYDTFIYKNWKQLEKIDDEQTILKNFFFNWGNYFIYLMDKANWLRKDSFIFNWTKFDIIDPIKNLDFCYSNNWKFILWSNSEDIFIFDERWYKKICTNVYHDFGINKADAMLFPNIDNFWNIYINFHIRAIWNTKPNFQFKSKLFINNTKNCFTETDFWTVWYNWIENSNLYQWIISWIWPTLETKYYQLKNSNLFLTKDVSDLNNLINWEKIDIFEMFNWSFIVNRTLDIVDNMFILDWKKYSLSFLEKFIKSLK
jgi:hypothetical protein